MSYDFYIQHNMCTLEWKIKAMIIKKKSLINKIDRNSRHALNRKIKSYRVWLFNQVLKFIVIYQI